MPVPLVGAVRRKFRWDYQIDPRIAWLSPMPPARSGIATYSRAVLAGLDRIGYTRNEHKIEPIWPVKQKHSATLPWHTMAVYHLGNNVEFHGDIYDHAIRTPGLVVIHDLALDEFVLGMIARAHPFGYQAMREAILNAPTLEGLPDAERNEPLRIPYIAHAARHARGIVVHSPFVEREQDVSRAEKRGAVFRGSLESMGMRTLVGMFGDHNAAKLIDIVLAAVSRLPEDVHVVLVGRRIAGYDVEPVVRASGLGGRVSVHSDVSDEDFLAWLCAADIALDLRFPHRGEVSGSLVRAMQCGRPTIVSGTGTYLDIPKDRVVHVSPGRIEADELATAIERLASDPNLRDRIGTHARAHMQELARSETTARGYAEAMDATLALLQDPARRALARWGGALVDLGVTEGDLAEGYGLSYARALDEFRS